jgi:hypothetical protein
MLVPRPSMGSENEEIHDDEIPQPQTMREDIYYSLKYLGQRELILHYQTLKYDQKDILQSNYYFYYLKLWDWFLGHESACTNKKRI